MIHIIILKDNKKQKLHLEQLERQVSSLKEELQSIHSTHDLNMKEKSKTLNPLRQELKTLKQKHLLFKENESLKMNDKLEKFDEENQESMKIAKRDSVWTSVGLSALSSLILFYDPLLWFAPFTVFFLSYFAIFYLSTGGIRKERNMIIDISKYRIDKNFQQMSAEADPLSETIEIQMQVWEAESKARIARQTEVLNESKTELENTILALKKGLEGEILVTKTLEDVLSDNCILINDICIPVRSGGTTQIDHLVIMPNIILAIETKHITGRYYPHSDSSWQWTPYVGGYVKEKIFTKNPINQAKYHARKLNEFLSQKTTLPVLPVVVLSNEECEFVGKDSKDCRVLNLRELKTRMKEPEQEKVSFSSRMELAKELMRIDERYNHVHHEKFLNKK